MKAKATVALVVVLIALAAMLVRAIPSEAPMQVSGGLTEREVADICTAVRRKMAPPAILPDLSLQTIFAAPGVILERLRRPKPKIWKLEARNHVFVAVTGRSPRDATPRSYVLWSVFRGTNAWCVKEEYFY
jgi:hypothetical protein